MIEETNGWWEADYAIDKDVFIKLDISQFELIKKLTLDEIINLPLGTIVYAKAVKDSKTNTQWYSDQLMIKGKKRLFYYREYNCIMPHTCYFEFDGYFGGLRDIKAYDYYTTKRVMKGACK